MHGRGKKLNPVKNYAAAKDFAAGKVIGRPKQVWVWDAPAEVSTDKTPNARRGHWEKVNAAK
jgi:hypothetical protein